MTQHDPDAEETTPGAPTYSRTEGEGGTTTDAAEKAEERDDDLPEFREGPKGDQGEYVPEALEATDDAADTSTDDEESTTA